MQDDKLEYAGFWIRTLAMFVDSVLILLVTVPLLFAIYGSGYLEGDYIIAGPADFILTWVFPAVAIITFWLYKQATPGKLLVATRIVDARTGGEPTVRQWVGRYFAYFLSSLPLGLGFVWVAFDKKKQGWHDKLAGTVVVRRSHREPDPVRFE